MLVIHGHLFMLAYVNYVMWMWMWLICYALLYICLSCDWKLKKQKKSCGFAEGYGHALGKPGNFGTPRTPALPRTMEDLSAKRIFLKNWKLFAKNSDAPLSAKIFRNVTVMHFIKSPPALGNSFAKRQTCSSRQRLYNTWGWYSDWGRHSDGIC